MSSLTKALGSIFSATNENYASLANVKFDFSLIKLEAPVEFNGIASALSTRRRIEAEEGISHKTARRLGALFEDVVPSTPKLISAYGLRMSEIMNTSDVNDVGTGEHGPFEPYVGADGTALWAAATSGISALGIYLLSCLLARAWDAKTATAIWVELVEARRKEIEEGLKNNHNISASSVVGAYQDITRKDLALWDSSARAWLRRADKAKTWSQCQLSLIVKNINTPIPGGPSTYDRVIHVWKQSMLTLERFLAGKPQEIIDGSVFLAFSAWHLYPDLIVLGAEPMKVEFKDNLIPHTGVGTVGVESRASEKEGVQWSLALSHLRYYGDPVVVRSDQDNSRLTFAQLQIVALGGLLGKWKVSSRDFVLVAEWFKVLWTRLDQPKEDIKNSQSVEFGWLIHFVSAADRLLSANDQDRQQNLILLKHGSRRAKDFLCDRTYDYSPFFGLLNTLTIRGLQEKLDVDSGIAYLRALAETLELRACDAIICHAHDASYTNVSWSVDYFEVATVPDCDSKTHMRWICPNDNILYYVTPMDEEKFEPEHRRRQISRLGEKCEIYETGVEFIAKTGHFDGLIWTNPPPLYSQDNPTTPREDMHQRKKLKAEMSFHAIVGGWRLGLFLKSEARRDHDPLQSYQEKARFEMQKTEKVLNAISKFNNSESEPGRLKDYMRSLVEVSDEISKDNTRRAPSISFISNNHKFHPEYSKSLYALDSASKIYAHLNKATVSLKLVARPLCKSQWFQGLMKRMQCSSNNTHAPLTNNSLLTYVATPLPDRHESFSCIALFDSGTVDLRPSDFENSFALCSEDTIYVPAILLRDPFVRVPEHEMKSITGNISHPGISILVPPFKPKVRELSDSYNLVMHEPYDFKREDNFRETSLHLSFTDWTFPLATEGSRTIDHDTHIVEAFISVRDRGRWVADIDILAVDFKDMFRFEPVICCGHGTNQGDDDEHNCDFDYTSIDSWEELLDGPSSVGIFRAHGNWAARLAAVSILSRDAMGGHNFGILSPDEPFCLRCMEKMFEKPGWNMREYESALPSFCID